MLKIYLISCLITLVITLIIAKAMEDEFKKEGYDVKKSDLSICEMIKNSLWAFIPIVNILVLLVMILSYETVKKEVIKKLGLKKHEDIQN